MMDEQLEMAIERVGRQRVFAMAKVNGWTAADQIPKYIWWGIVLELQANPS